MQVRRPTQLGRKPGCLWFQGIGACALALAFLLPGGGCQDAKVTTPSTGGGGGGASHGGTGGAKDPDSIDPPPRDAGSIDLPASTETPPAPATMTCAEETQKARQIPLALVVVMDASSSMLSTVGTSTKYAQVRQAMQRFANAPASAGIGIGVTFFPQPGSGSSCKNDLDCGYLNPPSEPPCQPTSICEKTVSADGVPQSCGGSRNRTCPGGDRCLPLGRCSVSARACTNIGEACPGGASGDLCTAVGKTCEVTDGQHCEPAAYESLAVPIAPLPDPGRVLLATGFAQRGPSGGTPLRPAIEGGVAALSKHLALRPDHKGALVVATDGAPFGCPNNTVADSERVLMAARAGTPAIDAYVIGVATPNDAMERMILTRLATAGGTGAPFIITETENVTDRFADTLAQIRGRALPCEFTIPKPTGPIDFAKVNVRITSAAGGEDVLYAGAVAKCDPVRGGWYYDQDPAANPPSPAAPTRIIACPATCSKLKAGTDATVDIRFGCATRTID